MICRARLPVPTAPGLAASVRWSWVFSSALGGAILVGLFVGVVDPLLARPRISATVFVLTLALVGVLIGYRSPGRTILEPGLAALTLVLLGAAGIGLRVGQVPSIAWVAGGLLLAFASSVLGASAGEVLQGTFRNRSGGIQWLWVLVAVIIGFLGSVYSVFFADTLLALEAIGLLICFGGSFLVTGFIAGYASPVRTIAEPALAATGIISLDVLLTVLFFKAVFPFGAVLCALILGTLTCAAGAWLGELAQGIRPLPEQTNHNRIRGGAS